MSYKNIIITSLKESFTKIWQNKFLFILLFILQILFFIVFSVISNNYVPKIIEPAISIFDYLNEQRLDEESVASNILQQKSILGEDPLSISRNFKEIAKNFKLYLMNLFILFVTFTTISWAITASLVYGTNFLPLAKNFIMHKNRKLWMQRSEIQSIFQAGGVFYFWHPKNPTRARRASKLWTKRSVVQSGRIFMISLFYLGLIFTFFYLIFDISLTEIAVENSGLFTKYILFLIISMILVYFMLVSLSLLHKTELKNIVQRTLRIGIKKCNYVLTAYFINISLFIMSAVSLFYFVEKNLFFLSLSILLMIFSFVFGRIFMLNVVRRLT